MLVKVMTIGSKRGAQGFLFNLTCVECASNDAVFNDLLEELCVQQLIWMMSYWLKHND
jgi:hypothetical protein